MWRATAPPRRKETPPPKKKKKKKKPKERGVLVPPLFDYPPIAARND
jgi:hypothetical protein